MNTKDFLEKLSNSPGVSGFEGPLNNIIIGALENYTDETYVDKLGNIISVKKGSNNKDDLKIMLAAHCDEIGLIITYIEDNGFLRFSNIGGIDSRTLLSQEVIIHGKEDVLGVIGAKPPHFQTPNEANKAIKIEDMTIDVGLPKDEVEKVIKVGDIVTIRRKFTELQGERVTGKALDDRAGVATLLECAKELKGLNHEPDIYFVSTVQEEVGLRGAFTSAYKINPDIGIAIDVGFGTTPELPKEATLDMGKGPGITLGGNIHPGLRNHLIKIADEYNIPYQIEIAPGPTGTDANAIQITRAGIPTLCISIPLRYMHTSVEIIDMVDIKNTAKLLAFFLASISKENLEGFLCY